MIFMITKKGQSALETLLVLGGVVVVATIILAVALNTGSENASVVRQKSEESTDILKSSDVYPSTINSIKCLNENTYLIMWSPFTNPDYNYSIIYAGIELEFTVNPFLVAEKNPISFSRSDVIAGQQSLIKNCNEITTEYIAIKTTNKNEGSRSSNLYYLVPQAEIPKVGAITFSPNGGSFTNSTTLALSCSTNGATIRYTTDGSDPTTNSAEYQSLIILNSTGQVKVKAFKDGYDASDIFTKNFNFNVAQIISDPKEGNVEPGTQIRLSTETNGVEIRYTTNGTRPSCSSGQKYTVPIQIDTTTTINAIGCKTGYSNYEFTGVYVIEGENIPAPLANPPEGMYSDLIKIKLEIINGEEQLEIYYKLTTEEPKYPPTFKDALYIKEILIDKPTWLSAITYDPKTETYSDKWYVGEYIIK